MMEKEIEPEPFYITQEGLDRLRERLVHLTRILPERAEEARRTAAYGDRSENDEYKTAKGALRRTKWQILEIEDQIKRAVIIMPGTFASGVVRIGSKVTLNEITSGATAAKSVTAKIFQIVGPHETDPARGRISYRSPLGAVLIDRQKGDVVAVKVGNGTKTYRIIEVQ